MNVVEVVLAFAAGRSGTRSITVSHAVFPAIILSNSQQNVTTIGLQKGGKICSTGLDIIVNVPAVAVGGFVTLVWGNLHETLLASTTDGVGVAGTFLHRNRCK